MFFMIHRRAPTQTGIMRRQAGLPFEPTQLRTSFIASSRCLFICLHLHALLYTTFDTCHCHTALRAPRPFLSIHTHPHTPVHAHKLGLIYPVLLIIPQSGSQLSGEIHPVRGQSPISFSRLRVYLTVHFTRGRNGPGGEGVAVAATLCFVILLRPFHGFCDPREILSCCIKLGASIGIIPRSDFCQLRVCVRSDGGWFKTVEVLQYRTTHSDGPRWPGGRRPTPHITVTRNRVISYISNCFHLFLSSPLRPKPSNFRRSC